MRKRRFLSTILLIMAALLMVACEDSDADSTQEAGEGGGGGPGTPASDGTSQTAAGDDEAEGIDNWLEQMNNGEIAMTSGDEALAWGLGYLQYYMPVEAGIDNLIYNALEVYRRLDTGELTQDSLGLREQNLLNLTEGIQYESEVALTGQIEQSTEARQAILGRIVESQSDLSPEAALASGEVIGIAALRSEAEIGRKYLVYVQESPDAAFEFLGVIIIIDAGDLPGESYSFQGWQDLPLLGDAAGPFWEDLPLGTSGDPANTDEGRPGVLLISESTFAEIK